MKLTGYKLLRDYIRVYLYNIISTNMFLILKYLIVVYTIQSSPVIRY